MSKTVKKRFHAREEDIGEIIAFVHEFLESCFTGKKARKRIELAVEEMAVNVIHYAYASGHGPIEVHLSQNDPTEFQIEIVDWGERFDPTRMMPSSARSQDLAEIEEGGLGIFLTNKVMDDITYQRVGTENHLIMRKKL